MKVFVIFRSIIVSSRIFFAVPIFYKMFIRMNNFTMWGVYSNISQKKIDLF